MSRCDSCKEFMSKNYNFECNNCGSIFCNVCVAKFESNNKMHKWISYEQKCYDPDLLECVLCTDDMECMMIENEHMIEYLLQKCDLNEEEVIEEVKRNLALNRNKKVKEINKLN